jgi:hypothetical protein
LPHQHQQHQPLAGSGAGAGSSSNNNSELLEDSIQSFSEEELHISSKLMYDLLQ